MHDYYGNEIFKGYAPDIGIHEYIGTTNISSKNQSGVNGFSLDQNYPNPFNLTTQISYQISKDGYVNLAIYNSFGQMVSTLVNNYQRSGKYSVKFTATGLSSGVYFCKFKSRSFTKTNKMLLFIR